MRDPWSGSTSRESDTQHGMRTLSIDVCARPFCFWRPHQALAPGYSTGAAWWAAKRYWNMRQLFKPTVAFKLINAVWDQGSAWDQFSSQDYLRQEKHEKKMLCVGQLFERLSKLDCKMWSAIWDQSSPGVSSMNEPWEVSGVMLNWDNLRIFFSKSFEGRKISLILGPRCVRFCFILHGQYKK